MSLFQEQSGLQTIGTHHFDHASSRGRNHQHVIVVVRHVCAVCCSCITSSLPARPQKCYQLSQRAELSGQNLYAVSALQITPTDFLALPTAAEPRTAKRFGGCWLGGNMSTSGQPEERDAKTGWRWLKPLRALRERLGEQPMPEQPVSRFLFPRVGLVVPYKYYRYDTPLLLLLTVVL